MNRIGARLKCLFTGSRLTLHGVWLLEQLHRADKALHISAEEVFVSG